MKPTRKFGNKRYARLLNTASKNHSVRVANLLRSKGHNARVIQNARSASVFISPKRVYLKKMPSANDWSPGKIVSNHPMHKIDKKPKIGGFSYLPKSIANLRDAHRWWESDKHAQYPSPLDEDYAGLPNEGAGYSEGNVVEQQPDGTYKILDLADSLPQKPNFTAGSPPITTSYQPGETYEFWDIRQLPPGATIVSQPIITANNPFEEDYNYPRYIMNENITWDVLERGVFTVPNRTEFLAGFIDNDYNDENPLDGNAAESDRLRDWITHIRNIGRASSHNTRDWNVITKQEDYAIYRLQEAIDNDWADGMKSSEVDRIVDGMLAHDKDSFYHSAVDDGWAQYESYPKKFPEGWRDGIKRFDMLRMQQLATNSEGDETKSFGIPFVGYVDEWKILGPDVIAVDEWLETLDGYNPDLNMHNNLRNLGGDEAINYLNKLFNIQKEFSKQRIEEDAARDKSKSYNASTPERRTSKRIREQENILEIIEDFNKKGQSEIPAGEIMSAVNDKFYPGRQRGLTSQGVANRIGELRRQGRIQNVEEKSWKPSRWAISKSAKGKD